MIWQTFFDYFRRLPVTLQQMALHGPESDAERSDHGQAVVTHRAGFMSFGWSLVFLENHSRTVAG
jgi:hypothetical protein